MKKVLISNIRLIIVCITLFATALVGFSYAYGSGTNTIYTRDELSEKVYDSGWVDLSPYLVAGMNPYSSKGGPAARRIGNVVYLRGTVIGGTFVSGTITTFISNIPTMFIPKYDHVSTNPLVNNGLHTYRLQVNSSGDIQTAFNSQGTIPSTIGLAINTSYIVDD